MAINALQACCKFKLLVDEEERGEEIDSDLSVKLRTFPVKLWKHREIEQVHFTWVQMSVETKLLMAAGAFKQGH